MRLRPTLKNSDHIGPTIIYLYKNFEDYAKLILQ